MTLTVGDLKKALENVPDDLPLHKWAGAGDWKAVTTENVGTIVGTIMLMQSKADPTYYAWENDSTWSKHKRRFRKPFKAFVFM